GHVKKFKKMILKTSTRFEIYIPYEKSNFEYVIGAVYSEQEIKNWKNYLESIDEELLDATVEEINKMKLLVGLECSYMRNEDHNFSS
ncbi:MAG: hypothetical protein EAZ16_00185, partial [Sphingobacteriales bacterium]